MVAMCLAYGQFRHQTPGLISESCRPLLGKWIDGIAGVGIDTLAVFATVFGVATSLGFGAMQISAGLSYVAGTPHTLFVQLIVIGVVTVLFILSAQTGLQRGIKYFNSLNMVLAVGFLVFVLVCGPTTFVMQNLLSTFGSYLQHLPTMSLNLESVGNANWVQDWTLFYWAWWISWAPFVGTFIARISKGRTIRKFVCGVLLVPTLFCMVWFSVFGGAALGLEMFDQVGIHAVIETKGAEIALFSVLDHFPLSALMSSLAIVLIGTFF